MLNIDKAMSTPTQQKALFLQSKLGECALATRDVLKRGAGDILVKNEAVGLNSVNWKVQTCGLFVEEYPAILGFNTAGTVEAAREGVTAPKDDRISYEGALRDNDRANFQQFPLLNESLAAKVCLTGRLAS